MKKIWLPLTAIATSVMTTNSFAESQDVTVYGKANLTINQIEEESRSPVTDEWQLNSNASRLGVKGQYAISDTLQAIYKMEYEVHIDDGSSSSSKGSDTFEQRNIYAGLKGSFGSIIAGKHDTPLKLAQGKIDRFNDQVLGDIKNYMEGEDRVSNIVMYTTPSASGFQATLAMIPGEDSKGTSGNDSLADGTSISINYKHDWIVAAIARNDDVDSQDVTRVAADFKLGDSQVGVIWQDAEKADGSADEDSLLVSGQHKLSGGWIVKAQYGMTDYSNDNEDTQIAIGVDKKLNKKAKVFAYYSVVERDSNTGTNDDSSFAIGYEIKF
jgi:predicted porin